MNRLIFQILLIILVWSSQFNYTLAGNNFVLQPGDIFLTRKDKSNFTPGYWNHTAIYVGGNDIVEAQAIPHKVIISNLQDFWNKYPEIKIVRYPNKEKAEKAAEYARKMIGQKYWLEASIFRYLKPSSRGENCVSVVRRSYLYSTGINYIWKKPDNINNFSTIYRK